MTETVVCFVTAPEGEPATKIARTLVEERLAACVNVVPGLRSIYAWEGEICDDAEVLLVVKTRRALLERLDARLHEIHPYDTPELLALPVEYGAKKYLAWVDEVARG
jgi:periplasmic divalent cation tolerance protein